MPTEDGRFRFSRWDSEPMSGCLGVSHSALTMATNQQVEAVAAVAGAASWEEASFFKATLMA